MNLYKVKWQHKNPEDKRKHLLQHVAALDYGGVEIICNDNDLTEHWDLMSIELVEKDIMVEEEKNG